MARQQQIIIPKGGLLISYLGMDIPPERQLINSNYELDQYGRPRRIDGYERFDGQPSPSAFVPTEYDDEEDYREQLFAGIEARRADIEAVPGSGKIRGVAVYRGDVLAWRNDEDGLLLDCYKATVTGWDKVTDLSGGDALSGSQKVRTITYNFQAGGARGINLYIVDGQNAAIEWDGSTATAIAGSLTGVPFLVAAFTNHLFLGFANGSLVASATGDPTEWTTGATEISMGDDLTALQQLPGGVFAIMCRKQIDLLYGNDSSDWQKKTHSETAGAVTDSVQVLGDALMLDGSNVTFLQRTQAFGDFRGAGISGDIEQMVQEAMTRCVGSAIHRQKGQYRLYLDNGQVLCATFNGSKFLGWAYSQFLVEPYCVTSAAYDGADDVTFIGCEDGFVYKTDTGRSFDGEEILAVLRFPFAHCGSPGQVKRFTALTLEASSPEDITLLVQPDFTYSNESEAPVSEVYSVSVSGRGGYFDVGVWDSMRWSNPITFRERVDICGAGHNVGLVISHTSAQALSFTILSATYTFATRGKAE